jgi:hypothetical protein
MKRPGSAPEWRHFFSQDAVKARLHAIRPGLKPNAKDAAGKDIAKDALNLEELAAEVQAAMADPESLSAILVHAIVNKPAEVEEIKMGTEEPMDGYPMAAMDAKIKAATDALEARFAPRLAELDALKAKEAARDAHATAQNDAELRRLSAFHGVRDASTLAIPALVTALVERLNLAIDGTGDPRPFVQGTAARRAASMGPVLPSVAYDEPPPRQDQAPRPGPAPRNVTHQRRRDDRRSHCDEPPRFGGRAWSGERFETNRMRVPVWPPLVRGLGPGPNGPASTASTPAR